jgi:hypothetical protein
MLVCNAWYSSMIMPWCACAALSILYPMFSMMLYGLLHHPTSTLYTTVMDVRYCHMITPSFLCHATTTV